MRFALVGSHSTGKTTLINLLKKYYKFDFIDSPTRKVAERYPINESGNDDTQMLCLKYDLGNIQDTDKIDESYVAFFDRCILDTYVYTYYLHKHGKLESDYTLDVIGRNLNNYIKKFTTIFYLESELEIEDDNTRSLNTEFRDEIAEIFEEVLKNISKQVEVVRVKGPLCSRFHVVTKHIMNHLDDVLEELEKTQGIESIIEG